MKSDSKNLKFSLCEYSSYKDYNIPVFDEKKNANAPYVNYGIDNRFPEYLYNLYLRSSV